MLVGNRVEKIIFYSDLVGSLRGSPSQAKEYVIPHGDWFGMVSSPHYLTEIVLYVGLLIASGRTDITIWLLFGFVIWCYQGILSAVRFWEAVITKSRIYSIW
ncbi:hypothetical protein AALP_AA2G121700 [Arabis alpina]|uniref:3-oxo-5-alpha-steroid 4-dehydrogenase C-terminal domain-containing protein n=1 Tax=Arabis alpina TaxID=50452 RepID=A0A087HGW9_ARAAL|nr:hypothetical protein AALP_AA2G121700 [Arabis alpina]